MTPQSRRFLDWLAVGLGSLAILLAALAAFFFSLVIKKSLESQTDLSQPYSSPVGADFLAGVSTAALWALIGSLLFILLCFNIAWLIIKQKCRPSASPLKAAGRETDKG